MTASPDPLSALARGRARAVRFALAKPDRPAGAGRRPVEGKRRASPAVEACRTDSPLAQHAGHPVQGVALAHGAQVQPQAACPRGQHVRRRVERECRGVRSKVRPPLRPVRRIERPAGLLGDLGRDQQALHGVIADHDRRSGPRRLASRDVARLDEPAELALEPVELAERRARGLPGVGLLLPIDGELEVGRHGLVPVDGAAHRLGRLHSSHRGETSRPRAATTARLRRTWSGRGASGDG